MFLRSDERIIVLEDDVVYPFTKDDLDKIQEAGIKTLFTARAAKKDSVNLRWNDRFKVLVPFYYSGESFVQLLNQKEQVLDWAKTCTKRKNKKVQFIFGLPDGGEFFWDAMLIKDFPASDDQIIDFVVSVQRVLVRQHGEIWLCLNNYLGDYRNWNNTHLPVLYRALANEFPGIPFYSLQFAYFSCGGTSPSNHIQRNKIKEYKKRFGIRFFVGPDYCEGLINNFDEIMQYEPYGFIVSPTHVENPIKHNSIEPWMVDAIKEANKKLR